MKSLLFILTLTLSFSVMAVDLGEDQKAPCPAANQSVKREAKEVDVISSDTTPSPVSTVAK